MVSWYRLSRQCDETFAPESPTIEKRDGDGHCDGIVDFCFKSSSGYIRKIHGISSCISVLEHKVYT